MSLGERLRQIRIERKMTQAEAAKQVGVSRSALNMYERNERDPDSSTISALARLYGVSTDWLLGETDDPTPRLCLAVRSRPRNSFTDSECGCGGSVPPKKT